MGNEESIVLGIKKPRSGLSLTSDVTPDHKLSGPCSYLCNEWIALSNHHRIFFLNQNWFQIISLVYTAP